MSRKLSQDEVIARIINRHGISVDISRVTYTTTKNKIEIGCTICGQWWWSRVDHVLEGRACPNCSEITRLKKSSEKIREQRLLSLEDVRKYGLSIHGNAYEYPVQNYNGSQIKLTIWCKNCKDYFWQDYNHHIHRRQGCPHCAIETFTSTPERNWLRECGVPQTKKNRQVRISKWIVDGLIDYTIYEFYGKYYHGDPRAFARDVINHKNNKTMGELYDRTLERHSKLENLGYTVRFVWELDYDAGLRFSTKHPSYKSE